MHTRKSGGWPSSESLPAMALLAGGWFGCTIAAVDVLSSDQRTWWHYVVAALGVGCFLGLGSVATRRFGRRAAAERALARAFTTGELPAGPMPERDLVRLLEVRRRRYTAAQWVLPLVVVALALGIGVQAIARGHAAPGPLALAVGMVGFAALDHLWTRAQLRRVMGLLAQVGAAAA